MNNGLTSSLKKYNLMEYNGSKVKVQSIINVLTIIKI